MTPFLRWRPWALLLCLALHALVLGLLDSHRWLRSTPSEPAEPQAVKITLLAAKPLKPSSPPVPAPTAPLPARHTVATPVTQAAPAPPSAEDWAFAAQYSLKNSKAYRYHWGQQVRSMMGTATDGPEQGMVRFRIEIAPNGRLSRIETLWSTSDVAEKKAREAMARLPDLPPIPTGEPLIFEKTIAFSPFAHDDPPVYRYDCEPDPVAFRNPFVWDGQSAKVRQAQAQPKVVSEQELEDCRKQLPRETVDAEVARDRHVMERWGWSGKRP